MSRRIGWLLVASVLVATSCGGRREAPALSRSGRFGSLRDLVLFANSDPIDGSALFVDRFEATRSDWSEFAASPAGERVGAGRVPSLGDPTLPIAGVDLRQARAFAQWRFLRLPRREEWLRAAVVDGRSRYPWGSREDPLRANTGELGLGHPTPVGTFESGRRGGGDQPYDLVGNVSEWTESVAAPWWAAADDPLGAPRLGRRAVLRTPAIAAWLPVGGVVPSSWVLAAAGDEAPHVVLGSDFQSPMGQQAQTVLAGDRRARTGLRACATAHELLANLLQTPQQAEVGDLEQLRRFVLRGRHHEALAAAWRRLPEPLPEGAITTCLRTVLAEAEAKAR